MEISHEYAQNIVDKTIRILNRNINIMNSLGIIVGSGDRRRINTYHQGAAKVIKTGKPLEITTEEATRLEGAKPGVNLPIYLNDRVAGVVGITGEPDEVRPFGELLKISVETMLTQTFLTEQLRMEQNAKEFFIDDIISGSYEKSPGMLLSRGKILGFDMSLKRIAIVIKIYEAKSMNFSAKEEDRRYLLLQKCRESLLNTVKNSFYNPQNMISYKGSDNFVIFYVINSENYLDIKQQLLQDIKIFDESLKNNDNFGYCIGIGCYYPGVSGLKKSYKEAVKAIRLREMYKVINENVVFACDLALEMMLIGMPKYLWRSYKHKIMAKCGIKNLLNQKKLISTLNAFFDNNLNSSSTAEFLDITRNTVNNRLNTIKSMTGLDPKKFNDAIKIKILLILNEIETFNKKR